MLEWRQVGEVWVLVTVEGRIVARITPAKAGVGFWARLSATQETPAESLGTFINVESAKTRVDQQFPQQEQVQVNHADNQEVGGAAHEG